MTPELQAQAKKIWDYMQLHQEPEEADVLIVLGSNDIRPVHKAAELYLYALAPKILVTGDSASQPEAFSMANLLTHHGIPKTDILVEPEAKSTGENALFSYDLLKREDHPMKRIIVVTKPYMERRAYATFKKQWPDSHTEIMVTSPEMSFEEYPFENVNEEEMLNIMVGDLQRIKVYPEKGFQIPQEIPDDVWAAWEELVAAGYDQFVIKE